MATDAQGKQLVKAHGIVDRESALDKGIRSLGGITLAGCADTLEACEADARLELGCACEPLGKPVRIDGLARAARLEHILLCGGCRETAQRLQ